MHVDIQSGTQVCPREVSLSALFCCVSSWFPTLRSLKRLSIRYHSVAGPLSLRTSRFSDCRATQDQVQFDKQNMRSLTSLLSFAALALAASRTSAPSGALVVGSSGKYSTIQAAVDALSSTSKEQVIFIQPGTYKEQVYIKKLSGTVTIYGYTEDDTSYSSNQVVITAAGNLLNAENDDATATLRVWTENFKMYNVNVVNSYGEGSQALALSAYAGVRESVSDDMRRLANIFPGRRLLCVPIHRVPGHRSRRIRHAAICQILHRGRGRLYLRPDSRRVVRPSRYRRNREVLRHHHRLRQGLS